MKGNPQTRHSLDTNWALTDLTWDHMHYDESISIILGCATVPLGVGGVGGAAVVVTAEALPLWDVEHVLWFWTAQNSSINGPKPTEDPKQRTLPAAVRTRDQHIHPFIHLRRTQKIQFETERCRNIKTKVSKRN